MNLFTSGLFTICGLICIGLLFQIIISSNLVVAIESSESNTNKISSGSELESIVTKDLTNHHSNFSRIIDKPACLSKLTTWNIYVVSFKLDFLR